MPRYAGHTTHARRGKPADRTWGRSSDEDLGPFHPSWMMVGFFTLLIGAGAALLYMPGSTASGARPPFLDALFTSASAATGTGLTVQETATYWSFTGQKIIVGLLQIGGVGSLIGSTMLLLIIARRVSSTEDRFLLKEFTGVQSPRGMGLLIFGVLAYAFMAQAAGSYLLATRLAASMPWDQALWLGIFHSASAFNNAGFEIMGLGQAPTHIQVQLVLAALSLLGSLSFIIIIDLLRRVFGRSLALDTKLALSGTLALLLVGMGVILLTESNNPDTLGSLTLTDKIMSALFHSISARTTGLVTINIASLAYPTLLVIVALMFIGGSSGSTSGGIKVNTFALLSGVVWSFVRGKQHAVMFETTVHESQVYRALAVVFLSVVLVFGVTLALTVTEGPNLLAEVFETVSAFSTTGFSLGITSSLSPAGKLLIAATMFVGRVGPVTLAFALSMRGRPSQHMYAEEVVNLG